MMGGHAMVTAEGGAMNSLLCKLTDLLAQKQGKPMEMEMMDNIRRAKDELEELHALLSSPSEEKEKDDIVKSADMRNLRRLSYGMEDKVDEFILCAGRRSSKDLAMHKSNISKEIGFFHDEVTGNRGRILEGKFSLQQIAEANEHRNAPRSASSTASYRPPSPAAPNVPRVGMKEQLINLLKVKGGDASQHKIKVICIVGMGGFGKTSLAKEVHDDVQQEFEWTYLVQMTQKPYPSEILQGMLSKVVGSQAGNKHQLIKKLREFLIDRRYFIIIDGIWSASHWRMIKEAFPENNLGSRIVITTRIKSVAKACCIHAGDSVYEMEPLTCIDSRKLFRRLLSDSDMEKVSDSILEISGYSPLAVISIASLLGKKDATEEEVMNSLRFAPGSIRELENGIKDLSHSYYDLPSYLKACALYLSILPVNHNIDRDWLVRKWISEGFVHEEVGLAREDVAKRYIDMLVDRNIIQPVGCCNSMEVDTYQVHCMMHYLLKSISGQENFVTLLCPCNYTSVQKDMSQISVCRLSVHHPTPGSSVLDAIMLLKDVRDGRSHIRSLTVFGHTKHIPFHEFVRLRVLELEGCKGVENKIMDHICRMQLLKYLGLKNTQLRELPPKIKDLTLLETLDVRNTKVTELPKEVVHLQKLGHLLIGDSDVHRWLKLPVVSKKQLVLLKVLCTIDLREYQPKVLQELGGLPELRELAAVLPYDGSADWNKHNDELLSSLGKCKTLQSLVIHGDLSCSMDDPAKCPRLLRKLRVTSMFTKFPLWIQELVFLALLDIRVCKLEAGDLKILQELPSLQSLVLRLEALPRRMGNANGGEEKVGPLTISKSGFSSLQRLSFDCLMPWIYFEKGAMPNLEHLELKFTGGPATTHKNGFGITHLRSLRKVVLWCPPSNTNVNKTVEAVRGESGNHQNWVTLHIKCYPTQQPSRAATTDQGNSSNDTPKVTTDSAPAVENDNRSKVESKAPGHHSVQRCNAVVVCDICEQEDHTAPECPLLKSPKHVAEISGHGVKDLGFHRIQGSGNKFGAVHVLQGSISAAQLENEFQELVPVKWQWMVKENGHNTFIVEFPSRAQLLKLTKHSQFHLMVTGVIVKVAEWCPSTSAKGQLKTVWVKVGGVPDHVRDYPSLCQVGSLIGSTIRVDISTRRRDTVSIQVAVLDAELIPRTMEVAVDTWLYDFRFEVEPKVGNNEGTDPDDKGFRDSDQIHSEDEIQDRGPNIRENGSAGSSMEGVFGTKSEQVSSQDKGKVTVSDSDVTKEAAATTPHAGFSSGRHHFPGQGNSIVNSGLENIGNTCFLNALLQSLLALDELRAKILLEPDVPRGGALTTSLKELFEKNDAERKLVPKELLRRIRSQYPQFKENQMEDSHELLTLFLDGLNMEEARTRNLKQDDPNSLINSIFRGQQSSTLSCTECTHSSGKHDHFYHLSLPIPSSRPATVEDCFALYTQKELLSGDNKWRCCQCSNAVARPSAKDNEDATTRNLDKAHQAQYKLHEQNKKETEDKREAIKRILISKVPPVLTIHLIRFSFVSSIKEIKKIEEHVSFQEKLDVHQFIDTRSKENHSTTYRLVAVVEHLGATVKGGHYVAFIRSDGSWFYVSDSEVQKSSNEEVLKRQAYILFYQREGD